MSDLPGDKPPVYSALQPGKAAVSGAKRRRTPEAGQHLAPRDQYFYCQNYISASAHWRYVGYMSVDTTGNTFMHDDAQLMSLVAGGQDDALATLIDRWRHRVWAFIDRMCGRLGRNDDIFQDVWMRIYLYRKKFDPSKAKSFKSYLFTVVVNCCRTNMAKYIPRIAANPALSDPASPEAPSPQPEPLDALIDNEQHHHVRQAVDRLPEKQRMVVLLYLLYDSDYSMIADALSLRNGTVRSHMSLALKNLRRILVRKSTVAEPLAKGQVTHE